jgi:hypothetical protein
MKKVLMFGVTLMILATSVIATILQADDPVEVNEFAFRIHLDRESGNMVLSCSVGCAWETLTFDCGPTSACSAEIDERGVITPARSK